MKLRVPLIAAALFLSLSGLSQAQLRLPDPQEALSTPGMEKMAGILFSRRLESGMMGNFEVLGNDTPESQRVQKIVSQLAKAVSMDRPNVVFQAKVVRNSEVNAFCIPGGYIYVYTGLLNHIDAAHPNNSDDALALVLGHEIAHAVLRHGLKDWAESKEYANILKDPQLFQSVLLANSRSQEFEADRYGALYTLRAGYAVSAGSDVFEKFPSSRQIYDRGMGSHPSGEERVVQLKKFEKQMLGMISLWDEALKASAAGRYDQASVALEILEAEFPNLPSIHNNLGWVYYRIYEKTDPTPMKEHPAYGFVDQLGIRVRGADGDVVILNEAADAFNKALRLNPSMPEAYEGSALCALEAGDLEKATEILQKADALASDRPQLKNLQGILAARQGASDQALNLYRQAITENPSFAPAHFNLALVQSELGQTQAAQESFEKFLALEPDGHWAGVARKSAGQAVAVAVPAKRADKLGPVTLGDSRESVVKALGEPSSSSKSATQMEKLEFSQHGLVVWIDDNQVKMVSSQKQSPEEGDLRIGDPESKVETAFGKPLKVQSVDKGTVWSYPGRGLSVVLVDSKVSEFILAAR